MSFVVEFLCKDQENTSGKCQLLKNVTHQIEKQFTLYNVYKHWHSCAAHRKIVLNVLKYRFFSVRLTKEI